MSTNYSENNNTTAYPISGGIKPNAGPYVGSNPEVERLSRVIDDLKVQIVTLKEENERVKDACFKYKERGDEFYNLLQLTLGHKVVGTVAGSTR